MIEAETHASVVVAGGGLGGVAAALAACELGCDVVLAEETDWLGGQLTSQAVPPDEHFWIESPHFSSASYARLRQGIRNYYRRNYPVRREMAADPCFNPGLGATSRICHEPRVAVAVIEEILAPYVASGRLRIWRRHKLVAASTEGDAINALTFRDELGDKEVTVSALYVVDATELGDVLDLASVEHVIGSESRTETGELHALDEANPLDQQAVSWCFALDYRPGENHVIDRPASYAYRRDHVAPFWPGPQLSWTDVHPHTLDARTRPIFAVTDEPDPNPAPDLWHFRRILARHQFDTGSINSDITLVNWPQIDYWERPLVGVEMSDADEALRGSRDLSMSFLYWMQTEAPRNDGGTGYPGLRLRPDAVGTPDGLAKHPYIRESRRIRAAFTILEEHIGVDARGVTTGSEIFDDSVGIGSYRIDLHPSTAPRNYVDIACYPFQIPLAALLPIRVENLLPGSKNIGTTHITNGAYRLHHVEWSIGEAVGTLTAYCLQTRLAPRKIREDSQKLNEYQEVLSNKRDIPLRWPEHIRCLDREKEIGSARRWMETHPGTRLLSG